MTSTSPNDTRGRSSKVTLLGAGPTNLATALRLSRQGVEVEIFDRAPGSLPGMGMLSALAHFLFVTVIALLLSWTLGGEVL